MPPREPPPAALAEEAGPRSGGSKASCWPLRVQGSLNLRHGRGGIGAAEHQLFRLVEGDARELGEVEGGGAVLSRSAEPAL